MTRLALVRHGESEWNAAERLQGHGGSGLSARGRAQAAQAAAFLRKSFPDVTLIARSDLQRVAETAAEAAAVFDVPVTVDHRLREIDVGTWTGLTWDEVAEHDGVTLSAWRAGEDVRRGGGETFGELRTRVDAALHDLVDATDGTVIVFTSGGPIRVAVAAALALPPLGERLLAPVMNCSVTELDVTRDRTLLCSYNRGDHLDL